MSDVQPVDLTRARDERCIPVAQEIVRLLSEYIADAKQAGGVKMGASYPAHEAKLSWAGATKQLLQLYLDHDLLLSDITYAHQLALDIVETPTRLAVESINESLTRMQRCVFDGKMMEELSLKYVDGILKTKAENKSAPASV